MSRELTRMHANEESRFLATAARNDKRWALLFLYRSMSRGKDCLMASCSFAKPVPKEPKSNARSLHIPGKPGMSRDDDILVVRWLSQPQGRRAQPRAAAVHKARASCAAEGASTLYAQKRRANGGPAVRSTILITGRVIRSFPAGNSPVKINADHSRSRGEVREWLKRAASKAAIPERVSGVRIPPSPPVLNWAYRKSS